MVAWIPPLSFITNQLKSTSLQLQNSDGVWLKLTKESAKKYCQQNNHRYNNSYNNNYNNNHNGPASNEECTDVTDCWVLQYHQHYRRTYLFPVVERNKENVDVKGLVVKRVDKQPGTRVVVLLGTCNCLIASINSVLCPQCH